MQNSFCESFNRRMRDALFNESLILGLDHARMRIANWADDDNRRRPHSASGYLSPEAYSAHPSAHAIGCTTPISSADRMLLHPRRTA